MRDKGLGVLAQQTDQHDDRLHAGRGAVELETIVCPAEKAERLEGLCGGGLGVRVSGKSGRRQQSA